MSSIASSIVSNDALPAHARSVWAWISRSTYFANTSTSRFTSVPGPAAERGPLSVSGISETVNDRSWTSTTVSDTPSTATTLRRRCSEAARPRADDLDQRANPSSVDDRDLPHPVDVALDQVAAEPVARAQRRARGRPPCSVAGPPARSGSKSRSSPRPRSRSRCLARGQAHPVDRHAVAFAHLAASGVATVTAPRWTAPPRRSPCRPLTRELANSPSAFLNETLGDSLIDPPEPPGGQMSRRIAAHHPSSGP